MTIALNEELIRIMMWALASSPSSLEYAIHQKVTDYQLTHKLLAAYAQQEIYNDPFVPGRVRAARQMILIELAICDLLQVLVVMNASQDRTYTLEELGIASFSQFPEIDLLDDGSNHQARLEALRRDSRYAGPETQKDLDRIEGALNWFATLIRADLQLSPAEKKSLAETELALAEYESKLPRDMVPADA